MNIPAEAEAWVRPEDVPTNIDHNFAIMEINKQQVKALAAAEAQRRAEADAARAKAEEQVCVCVHASQGTGWKVGLGRRLL